LIERFDTLGFSLADRYAQFFLPMVLHRVLNLPRLSSAAESTFRFLGATQSWRSC
jgi:hypothetical protein